MSYKLIFILYFSLIFLCFSCVVKVDNIGNGFYVKTERRTSKGHEKYSYTSKLYFKNENLGSFFDNKNQIHPDKTYCIYFKNKEFFLYFTKTSESKYLTSSIDKDFVAINWDLKNEKVELVFKSEIIRRSLNNP